MRIAFVHDWLVVNGGAEKVTREILRCYDADVFALIDHLSDEDRTFILGGKRTRRSFIQWLPWSKTHYRYYLPLFPLAIQGLDLRSYDLIISASYAVAKGVRVRPGQIHVCYIHTPMRYAWSQEAEYLKDHGMSGPKGLLVRGTLAYLRRWDRRTAAGVDRFVANSRNVQERVRTIYGREADVLLPPVDVDRFRIGPGPRDHFLSASRLVPYKRVDRIVEAFRELPEERLVVLGDGPEMERLRSIAPTNVTFLGHVEQDLLVSHMQRAKALIVAAEEDLGLTPLEAQACGTPTIALRRGGYLETVKAARNGIFFDDQEPTAIAAAVREALKARFETPERMREGMMPYAAESFRAHFKAIVERTIREHAAGG